MKKRLFGCLIILSFCFLPNGIAKAEENLLNDLFITQNQLSISNHTLVQKKVNDLYAKLNLSETQKEKVKLLDADSSRKVSAVLFKLTDINERKTLVGLKKSTINNDDQIKYGKDFVRTTRAKMKAIREENMTKFAEILTPEQKVVFEQFKTELNSLSQNSYIQDR